jgi:hypothetical protein
MKRRARALRRRRGRATSTTDVTEFKHLLHGRFFKFISDEEDTGPRGGSFAPTYVKIGPRVYMSPLAPSHASKYHYRAPPSARVRAVASYATHAFPSLL